MPDKDLSLALELAKRAMEKEMPEQYKAASFHLAKLRPGVGASTSPDNEIFINPESWGTHIPDQNTLEDVLTHELTHVKQNQRTGGLEEFGDLMNFMLGKAGLKELPHYGQDPAELEAFQASKDRIMKQQRPMGFGGYSPPFSSPDAPTYNRDRYLPNLKDK